ncbi:MAG: ATP-binding cassette domain-containing protein [Culicoidibacterales bacterium]
MCEIVNLSFGFDELLLENVNLSLKKGNLYCLVGNNGAGKSTFFRLLSDELKATVGEIIKEENTTAVYVQVQYEIVPFLSEKQLYTLIDRTNNTGPQIDEESYSASNKILGDYSTGMLQKVMLNLLMNVTQELILIDAPLAALDMVNKDIYIKRLKAAARRGKTIIISTQEPDVAYQLQDNLLILANKTINKYENNGASYEIFREALVADMVMK